MRALINIAIACCALIVSSCSTVPALEEASGESNTGPLVSSVVNSVKCEITVALAKLAMRPDVDTAFPWVKKWEVKADLTLTVANLAGVAPTVSYTKYFHNAFNFDAGSTSLTSNSIPAVQQFLNFGAGVNYNETATRQETVSFTLTYAEVSDLVSRRVKRLKQAKGRTQLRPCEGTGGELRGGLGLEEWLEAAVDPVLHHSLKELELTSPDIVSPKSRPPINSIGHIVSFVIVAGGSISPNWSMIAWKGPATSGNLATLTRTRTHQLNLAFGPTQETTAIQTKGLLQLLNNSLKQGM